jgi:hypothetical protein
MIPSPIAWTQPNPPSALQQLVANVRAGLHLAFFQKVPRARFHTSPEQLVLLATLNGVLGLCWEWALTAPPRLFDGDGLAIHAAWVLSTLVLAFLATRETQAPGTGLTRTAVMLLSPLFVGWIGFALLELGVDHWEWFSSAMESVYYGEVFAIWLGLVYAHVLSQATDLPRSRMLSLAFVYGFALFGALRTLPSTYLWSTEHPPTPPVQTEESLDAEAILHEQRSRVESAVAELLPQRPGVTDLYFVGFGSDSRQDVFMKEIRYVRQLLDRRFDTDGRSIALINHHDTLDSIPLATASNLADTLRGLAGVMDPEEDILLLYLTGHGSKDHELRVRFPGLPLNTFGPDRVGALLDESGLRWRVVIVQACYSGGYVDALKGDDALVLTASASDQKSFGCSSDADLTYFARAYFEDQLEQTHDLVAAFEGARQRLEERERSEEKTPSQPQIALGESMARKLEELRARLGE